MKDDIVENSGGMTVVQFLELLVEHEILTPAEAWNCLMSPEHRLPDDIWERINLKLGCN